MAKQIGIYRITSPTGRIYIGSSINIKKRFNKYKNYQCGVQVRLYNSLVKYGVACHTFEIIHLCDETDLMKLEAHYGRLYNVLGNMGMNCRLPKADDKLKCVSKHTTAKMSKARIGKKWTDELRLKMKTSRESKSDEENKQRNLKISSSLKGLKKSKQHNSKVSQARRKLILNYETGIFYLGISEAATSVGMKRTTLNAMLSGQNNNVTPFNYA